MPRIHWKLILTVFALAIGLRVALHWVPDKTDSSADDSPPTLVQTGEEDEEEITDPDAGGAADLGGDSEDGPPVTKGALAFDVHPIDLKPRPEDEEVSRPSPSRTRATSR